MSRGGSKRRYRLRRKRRDGSIVGEVGDEVGGEVVAEFGCCLVEVVGGLSVLVGLMFVPYVLLS